MTPSPCALTPHMHLFKCVNMTPPMWYQDTSKSLFSYTFKGLNIFAKPLNRPIQRNVCPPIRRYAIQTIPLEMRPMQRQAIGGKPRKGDSGAFLVHKNHGQYDSGMVKSVHYLNRAWGGLGRVVGKHIPINHTPINIQTYEYEPHPINIHIFKYSNIQIHEKARHP